MATLFNVQTRLPEEVPEADLSKALITGTHAYQIGTPINVIGPEGTRTVDSSELNDAITKGYMPETSRQAAVREYVSENKGLSGAAKVGLGQFADEALFSIPETIYNATADLLDVAKKDALKKEHAIANALGGVAGFGASMFVGGPLFKGASAAGHVAERAVLEGAGEASARAAEELAVKAGTKATKLSEGVTKIEGTQAGLADTFANMNPSNLPSYQKLQALSPESNAEKIAKTLGSSRARAAAEEEAQAYAIAERLKAGGVESKVADYMAASLVRKTLASAANMGVQAGVIAAPKAITEALLGDPEQAAEHAMLAIGAGALLGGAGQLTRSFLGTTKDLALKGVAATENEVQDRAQRLMIDQKNVPLNLMMKEQELHRKLTQEEADQVREATFKEFGVTPPIFSAEAKIPQIGAGGKLGVIEAIGGHPVLGAASVLAGPSVIKGINSYLAGSPKLVDGLLFAEKAMKSVAKQIDKIPEYISNASGISPEILAGIHLQAINRFLGEKDDKEMADQYNQIHERLNALSNNPEEASNKIAGITTTFTNGGAPKIADSLNIKYQQALATLQAQMPSPTLNANPFEPKEVQVAKGMISQGAMDAFAKKIAVIQDPFIVFQKIGTGTLSNDEVATLKQFYPNIYQKGLEKITANPQPLNFNQRTNVDLYAGANITGSQGGPAPPMTPAAPTKKGKGPPDIGMVGPKTSGKKFDIHANNAMTSTQSLFAPKTRK